MAGRQIGWGFVGTSGWVGSRFAPAVQAAGHRVAGGFGSSAESSAKFAERFGATPYRDLNEMLADDAVEAGQRRLGHRRPRGAPARHRRVPAPGGTVLGGPADVSKPGPAG